ncbi:MAG: hypothetical protein H7834_06930 [Magnetococcus sp. YQC-9]
MKPIYYVCLTLSLMAAPLSLAWADEPGKAPAKAVHAPAKTGKSEDAKSKDAARAAQVKKDKEHVRQIVLAKKQQRLAKKGTAQVAKRPTDKTMDSKAKNNAKAASNKATAKSNVKKPTRTARGPAASGTLGIRTWNFPESSAGRVKKLNELAGHIRAAENAYDAENVKYQKLLKTSKEQAKPDPKAVTTPDAQLAASQRRLSEIMQKLDSLHHHRNEVADIVFLKNVRN